MSGVRQLARRVLGWESTAERQTRAHRRVCGVCQAGGDRIKRG